MLGGERNAKAGRARGNRGRADGLDEQSPVGERGTSLWLAGLNPAPLEMVRRSPVGQALGSERLFVNLRRAVQAYEEAGRSDSSQTYAAARG